MVTLSVRRRWLLFALVLTAGVLNYVDRQIIAVLKHPPLASTLRQHGAFDVRRRTWSDAARQCQQVYDQALTLMTGSTNGRH